MEWWQKAMLPMRRVWIYISKRLGIRKSGLLKLQHDVSTCQYKDVHIMWEILQRSEMELSQASMKKRRSPFWKIVMCARAPYLCGGY
ncbi:uncharacterized protein LOC131218992 [Magnolia sinica]|uniref:uncharacterized protein LOC131218992 n=1 Tax=Magnolia sinica TaxID=86752 RepID=UPI00265A8EB9|nr:uncharacterized protein LOC131218992 [Magnolia sinica]